MSKLNKSFLKWAGGKSKSIQMIKDVVGNVSGRFIEPFVGSGVVFLNIEAKEYIIGDTNKDLINIYSTLKNDPNIFITECEKIFTQDCNDSDFYYAQRKIFNESTDDLERSVLFIYLNRHCFNGLCRYNKQGIFNVPFGRYKTTYFPKQEFLLASERLKNCELHCSGFEDTISRAKEGDVIYCDSPYVPLSKTASFTDYSSGGFTDEDHKKLAQLAEESSCLFLISNHSTEFTTDLYCKADEIQIKEVNRFISAKTSSRKSVHELLAIYNKGI